MTKKEWQRHMAYEALVILGMLALLLFVCRLWPILLLVILGIFAAALRLVFLSSPKVQPIRPEQQTAASSAPQRAVKSQRTAQNVEDTLSFGELQTQVTDGCGRNIQTPGGCGSIPTLKRGSSAARTWPSCSTGRGATGRQ